MTDLMKRDPYKSAWFNLLFGLGLCVGIALLMSSCRTPYPTYDHYTYKPEVRKVYDKGAGEFDYERYHPKQ